MKLRRHAPLVDQVLEILREQIASGAYAPDGRLPSETELAEEFDVSRATVRSALALLSAEGLVKRRHGAGTFVSQAVQIANPLNTIIDYYDLLTSQGFEFGFKHLGAEISKPTLKVAQALKLGPDARAVEIRKAFTADGELLIHTTNVIPEWVYEGHLSAEEITQPDATEPLFFQFLAERCRQPLDYYIATVRPEIAQNIEFAGDLPPVDPLLPVLIIEEVGYSLEDKPVIYEAECLFGNRMKFDLIRRLHPGLR